MSILRQKMIDAMQLRGFSPRTHECYLRVVRDLAKYYHQSPDQLNKEQLQAYLLYLVQKRNYAPSSCRQSLNALRFLYLQVLHCEAFEVKLVTPKREQRIPELLTQNEVARIIEACTTLRNRTLLRLCYGCGLRVSELVALKVRHIDGDPKLLRIEQAKGAKDRYVRLSDHLLDDLRQYWRAYHPKEWLFVSHYRRRQHQPLSVSTVQKIFDEAKGHAKIDKVGGIHTLRHAYATHQLSQGLPIQELQQMLGHRHIQSTLRYLHWMPQPQAGDHYADLIADLEGHHHDN
ncbi:MAG: tyrosine-type recombinase/integrase [Gammaproteobacteria bacterium]|nr:tyrosine-type recombinase/integrase [Gammaproteobacteria bacterium]